jgi:hypothetical protein
VGGSGLTRTASAALLFSAGCAARQTPPVEPPLDPRAGVTSVRVLEAADRKPPAVDVVAERLTPAFASDENALPIYPSHALEAGCQQGTVAIRLHVGEDGNVAQVASVPNRPVPDDPCHSAFWASTAGTVQAWRFAPAFRQTPKPGPDEDGDGRPDFTLWAQSPAAIYLDFEFAFRIAEGRGQVLSR